MGCLQEGCTTTIVDSDTGYCVEHSGNIDGLPRITKEVQNHYEATKPFQKNDDEKVRMELLDPEFMVGVAQVLTFGAKKYDAHNWKRATKEDTERIKGSILRHQMAYMSGEIVDPETNLNHMYHVGCNAMFLAYFDRHKDTHVDQGTLSELLD